MKNKPAYPWIIFSLLAIAYVQVSVHRTGASTLALDIMHDMGIGGGVMTLITSGYFYAYGFMQVPAGMLADRLGGRRTISWFLALGGLGSLLFGLSAGTPLAVLGRIFVGAGMGMVFIPAVRVIMAWFPKERHDLLTGLLLSSGSAGMLLATVPLVWLGDYLGWRGIMLGAGGVSLVTALLIWLVARDTPEGDQKHPAGTTTFSNLWETVKLVARHPMYRATSLWFFCTPALFFSITGLWASPYFIQGYGLTPEQAGQALFCMAFGGMVSPPLLASVYTRLHYPKRYYLAGSSVATALLALPLIAPYPVVPLALLPLWAAGLGFASACGPALALSNVKDYFPAKLSGTAMGMTNLFLFVGITILQIGSGWIMEWQKPSSSSYTIDQYAFMFIIFVVMQIPAFCAMAFYARKAGSPTL